MLEQGFNKADSLSLNFCRQKLVVTPHEHYMARHGDQESEPEAKHSPHMAWPQASTTNSRSELEQRKHFKDQRLCMEIFFEVNVESQYSDKYHIISLLQHEAQMSENAAPADRKMPPLYIVESAFKAAFIVMAPFNMSYTILVGFLASLCGLIRMLKVPQLNKEYLQKALMNNHGQNILYIGMGCVGNTNFLFFAPLILYFFYGLAEFHNQWFAVGTGSPKIRGYVDQIRHNRWFFMETKSRLEIIYFIYLLVTIPIDLGRILKCLLMGQYNMLRFRLSPETKHAAANINAFISNKISGIGFLHSAYTKLVDYIYKFATQNPGQ